MYNMGLEKGCPCCKLYKDGLEFKKVIELERAGLVIYRHTTPVNSVASVSQPEKAFNTKNDVFIIHNTRNMNVSTSNYMSEFEQAINCPRCKYIVKHTKELLLNVPFIRKKDVIGICDHCRFRKRINERCNKCQFVVEEFLKKQSQKQAETRDYDKQDTEMLSKIKYILKDAPKALFEKSKTQTHSGTSLKKSHSHIRSPTYHVPRVKDMFDIEKKTEKKQQLLKGGFLGQFKSKKLYITKSDSEITVIEAKKRLEHNEPRKKILFNSIEDIARPGSLNESGESLKESAEFIRLDKKHHKLMQKLKPKIEVDPTLKRVPSEELEEYLKKKKYTSSPVDYETKKWPSEESDIHEKENIKNRKKYQHSYDDLHHSKYDQEVSKSLQKKEDIFIKGIQTQSRSDHNIQRYTKYQRSYDDLHHSKYDQEVPKSSQKKEDIFVRGLQKQRRSDHNIGQYSKYQHSYDDLRHSKYDQEVSKSLEKKEDIFVRGFQKQRRSDDNIRHYSKYQHSYDDLRHSKYDQEVSKSSKNKEGIFVKGIQKQIRSDHNIRRYASEETLLRSTSETTENKLQKDFSYFFIKETDDVKKKPRKRVSSSELIKDTQDMYRARAEEERIKKEKELKEKLEAEEKKRLAKIERKRWQEEQRRLEELKKKQAEEDKIKKAEEDKIKKTEDDKIKSKKIEEEQDLHNKKPSKHDTESQEKGVKTSKETSGKSKSIKLKTEVKESKIEKSLKSERDSLKSKKELDKQEKEESLRLEKERKLKEKADKEEQMRKANEVKQRQKEEKDKEKANKEEQMRLAKEEKQRQKEEKEKEKANKEEQMRKAKEEKQREKEEKEKQEAQLRIDKEQKQREKEQRLKEKEERQSEKEQNKQQKEENEKKSKENEEQSKNKQIEEQLLADAQKHKESKLKKRQEDEANKKEAQQKLKSLKEVKEVEPEKPQSKKIAEESKMKDLNINQVKVRRSSPDDLILRLVRLKQRQSALKDRPTRMSQLNVSNKTIHDHKGHKNLKSHHCMICLDSDLELDIENIRLNETKPIEKNDIIIGQKVFKHKPSLATKKENKEISPLLFSATHNDENIVKTQEVIENIPQEKEKKPPTVSAKYVEQELPKGIIRYALSDRTFIEKGWTMLPTEKVVRKMNVYRMRPAHPEFDWFEHNKNKKLICYDTGEKLAEFDDNGKGRWFYRSGKVALDYYDAEEINAQQRIVIFSSGEPDERGCSRPFAILATFDYLGNGIVFDHAGKIRLKYNQTEGVVLDRAIGPVSHWKWHTLNDPPVLQQVMIDTQMAHKDPEILKLGGLHDNKPRPDNEEMLAIEFDNFIKEKSKKLSQKFKPFQIKMKALKINEYFSLKVLDQATVYLIYRDGSTNLKLNIGMILDHQEIVDTDTAEVGEVSNSLERFPARTDSLAGLQKSVAHAQCVERARAERAHRLRPAQPCASADRLVAGMARPRPAPPPSAACPCKKPSSFNLCYDTRLI